MTIPASVTAIGDSAFRSCLNLSSAGLSEGLETIGQNAFRGCQKLDSIALPASVASVGAGAFYDCTGLERAVFAPGGGRVTLGDNLFARCWRLAAVTLPQSIDCIGEGMFQNCYLALSHLEIPQGVADIKNSAFASCNMLTAVTIPDSVTSIGSAAFAGCGSLKDIYFGGSEAQWRSIRKAADVTAALANVTIHYNSSGPSTGVDPVDPVDPIDPVDPVDPVDPTDPVDPEPGPDSSTAPTVPVGPVTPAKPDTPPEPAEPALPTAPPAAIAIDVPAAPAAEEYPVILAPYADLDSDGWYREYAAYMIDSGLMVGITSDTFAPNAPLTRGMLATILYRAAGSPAGNGAAGFTDVKSDSWYAGGVAWAENHGLMTGYGDNTVRPNNGITRQELAVILWRLAQQMGIDADGGGAALSAFCDRDKVSAWAVEAMSWACRTGIITGYSDGSLAPADGASRVETAAMVVRFLKLVESNAGPNA